jgi:hypothetical protein
MIENYGTDPESSVEMNLRRIISMVHDLQTTRGNGGSFITPGPTSSRCDQEIAQLQYELGSLCKTELTMKDLHKQKLHELEDAWDKLVSLRRHISIFRSQIEEMTIEDIHNQAAYPPSSSSSSSARNNHWMKNPQIGRQDDPTLSSSGRASSVTEAGVSKQIHFHILREKLHIRTQIENSLQHYEKKLDSLREDIRKYSSILMESSQVSIPLYLCLSLSLSLSLSVSLSLSLCLSLCLSLSLSP